MTTVVLVSRPERSALKEAARTRAELSDLGVRNVHLVLNGVFEAMGDRDPVARALAARGRAALESMPEGLLGIPRSEVPLLPFGLVGIEAIRAMLHPQSAERLPPRGKEIPQHVRLPPSLSTIIDEIAARGRGVVMTMGKGGVGKTSIASAVAVYLARRGHRVHLSTTRPGGPLGLVTRGDRPRARGQPD